MEAVAYYRSKQAFTCLATRCSRRPNVLKKFQAILSGDEYLGPDEEACVYPNICKYLHELGICLHF